MCIYQQRSNYQLIFTLFVFSFFRFLGYLAVWLWPRASGEAPQSRKRSVRDDGRDWLHALHGSGGMCARVWEKEMVRMWAACTCVCLCASLLLSIFIFVREFFVRPSAIFNEMKKRSYQPGAALFSIFSWKIWESNSRLIKTAVLAQGTTLRCGTLGSRPRHSSFVNFTLFSIEIWTFPREIRLFCWAWPRTR